MTYFLVAYVAHNHDINIALQCSLSFFLFLICLPDVEKLEKWKILSYELKKKVQLNIVNIQILIKITELINPIMNFIIYTYVVSLHAICFTTCDYFIFFISPTAVTYNKRRIKVYIILYKKMFFIIKFKNRFVIWPIIDCI